MRATNFVPIHTEAREILDHRRSVLWIVSEGARDVVDLRLELDLPSLLHMPSRFSISVLADFSRCALELRRHRNGKRTKASAHVTSYI